MQSRSAQNLHKRGTSGAKYLYDGIETAGVAVSGTTLANRFVHGPRMNEILAGFSTAGPTPANYWSEDERGSLVAIACRTGRRMGHP